MVMINRLPRKIDSGAFTTSLRHRAFFRDNCAVITSLKGRGERTKCSHGAIRRRLLHKLRNTNVS